MNHGPQRMEFLVTQWVLNELPRNFHSGWMVYPITTSFDFSPSAKIVFSKSPNKHFMHCHEIWYHSIQWIVNTLVIHSLCLLCHNQVNIQINPLILTFIPNPPQLYFVFSPEPMEKSEHFGSGTKVSKLLTFIGSLISPKKGSGHDILLFANRGKSMCESRVESLAPDGEDWTMWTFLDSKDSILKKKT